jgi:hypothetical protein
MIKDYLHHFTTIGSPFAPTGTGDNVAPLTYDTSPLGLPSGSGGGGTTGYNAGSSTNAGRDLGIGTEMWLNVLVTTTVTSGGAPTVTFYLGTDAAQTLASFASSTGVGVVIGSAAYLKATLVAGFNWKTQLPALTNYSQFLGFVVTIGVTTLTAGAFEAALVPNVQQSDLYLSGYAVA